MRIEFICPNIACEKKLSVALEKAGKKVRCPGCDEVLQVPERSGDNAETLQAVNAERTSPSALDKLAPVLMAAGRTSVKTMNAEYEIASGGMGTVHLCSHKSLGRHVAMKIMRERIAASLEHRLRFLEEAQITGQLEHPNIVPVHEIGQDESGNLFFTMKHVKGSSLREMLDKRADSASSAGHQPLTINHLLTVFLKACDGIAFAHSKGVIHRDLKPDNIMVGDYGEVLVMDWGLAKVVGDHKPQTADHTQRDQESGTSAQDAVREAETLADGIKSSPQVPSTSPTPPTSQTSSVQSIRSNVEDALTMEGAVQGTPQYMPPEQAEGKIDEIDQRSDIYSLGAILYEILALQRPVTGKNAQEVLLKVIEHRIESPEKRAPDRNIPKELSAIAMKAMSGNKGRRYQSVSELQQDINLYLDGRSVSAKEDSTLETISKLVKRNKGIVSAGVVAAIAVVVVLSVAYRNVQKQIQVVESALAAAQMSESKARTSTEKQINDAMAAAKSFSIQAARAAANNRFLEAESRIADAESLYSASPWIAFARGKYAEVRKEFEEAERLYEKAIAADSSITEARNSLAKLKAIRGDLSDASQLLASAEAETDWKNLLRTARLLYRAGKYSESSKVNARALSLLAKSKDSAIEKDNTELNALIEVARYSVEDAKAHAGSQGFYEELKNASREDQYRAFTGKLTEIHGGEVRIGEFHWRFVDETKKNIQVKIHHTEALKYIHPLAGFPIEHLSLTYCRNVRLAHALIGMPLKFLDLRSTPVADISPLNKLPLEHLNISNAPHIEIAALRGMKLKHLDLADTRVTDLSPLEGMTSLEYLSIFHIWPMKDISPLKGLQLKTLNATYTSITDISPLEGMPLEDLQMYNTPVTSISALRGMNLVRFDCSPMVKDLSPILGMPLQQLRVENSPVFKMEIVKDMPLQMLNANGCLRVDELSELKDKALNELWVDDTKVADLSPLAGMPLKSLSLKNTRVTDLSPLKGMPLDRLSLERTQVADLAPLSGSPVAHLNLGQTRVADLSPLGDCENLRQLTIHGSKVTDLSPLSQLKQLRVIYLSSTKVTSLEPLRGLELARIVMADVDITDLSPLLEVKNMWDLRFGEEQQFDEKAKAVIESLKGKGIQVRFLKKNEYFYH